MTVTVIHSQPPVWRGRLASEVCSLFGHRLLFGTASGDVVERWCQCRRMYVHYAATYSHAGPPSRLDERRQKRADAVVRDEILNAYQPKYIGPPYESWSV